VARRGALSVSARAQTWRVEMETEALIMYVRTLIVSVLAGWTI
jgi:hypothetical protein